MGGYTRVLEISSLLPSWRIEMFKLYQFYYADSNEERFYSDLADKDYVIIMKNKEDQICGFSTLKSIRSDFSNRPVRIIFSGDTIIHHDYWGMQDPSLYFLRLSGHIWKQDVTPLYWLLITKGHRTYRYLNVFTKRYFPSFREPVSEDFQTFMHQLSKQQFGNSYIESSGILHFDLPQGRLREEWSSISDRHKHLPEVEFFLQKNPGYIHGDELVCLAELSPENLRPRAKRIFLRGLDD